MRSRVLATAVLSSGVFRDMLPTIPGWKLTHRARADRPVASRRAERTHLRRRDGDSPPGADPGDEQAPAAGRPVADGLLPAPAPAARWSARGAARDRAAARRRLHRSPWRRARGLQGDGRAARGARGEALFDVDLSYKLQVQPGGIAQVVGMARAFAGGDGLVVCLGDNIFEHAHADAISGWRSDGALVFAKEVPDPENFGVIVYDGDGGVADV